MIAALCAAALLPVAPPAAAAHAAARLPRAAVYDTLAAQAREDADRPRTRGKPRRKPQPAAPADAGAPAEADSADAAAPEAAPEAPAAADAAEAGGEPAAAAIAQAAGALGGADARARAEALEALGRMARHAGRPGADAEARAVFEALLNALAALPPPAALPDFAPPPPSQEPMPLWRALADHRGACDAARQDATRWNGAAQRLFDLAAGLASAADVPRIAALGAAPSLAPHAARALARIPGPEAREALAALLDPAGAGLPALRAAAAGLLAERGDAGAESALRAAFAAEADAGVREALREALAALGTPPWGLEPAWPADPAAQQRWAMLGARAAQAAAAAGRTADARAMVEVVLARGARWSAVRAALSTLAQFDPADAAERALDYLKAAELRGTVAALVAGGGPEMDDRLVRAYTAGNTDARITVLTALQRRNSPRHAETAARAREADDPVLRLTASAMGDGMAAAGDLLAVALGGPPGERARAMRTFLDNAHAAAVGGDRAGAAAAFRALLDGPFGHEAQQEAIEALGACGQPQDRERIEAALEHPLLAARAQRGLAAWWAAQSGDAEAAAALAALAEHSPDDTAAEMAATALAAQGAEVQGIAMGRGWIARWQVIGPFAWDGAALERGPVDPRRGGAVDAVDHAGRTYAWRAASANGLPAVLDLEAALAPPTPPPSAAPATGALDAAPAPGQAPAAGPETGRSAPPDASGPLDGPAMAYAAARIETPDWMPVYIEIDAPGPAAVYLDGERVLSAADAGRTRAALMLRPGIGRILVHTARRAGPWPIALRLTLRDGAPLDLRRQRLPDPGTSGTGLRSAPLAAAGDALP